jgi:heme A synthase
VALETHVVRRRHRRGPLVGSTVTAAVLSPNYFRLATLGFAAAVGFGGWIALAGDGATWLHETAGLVLFVLIVAALVLAWRVRSSDPGAAWRATAALVVLIAMGSSGAALGVGALPAQDDAVPGLLLVLLAGTLAEMARYTWPWGRARPEP